MKSSRTGLTIGLLAGAAIATYVVSKFGKSYISKIGEQTARLRESLAKEIKNFKKNS